MTLSSRRQGGLSGWLAGIWRAGQAPAVSMPDVGETGKWFFYVASWAWYFRPVGAPCSILAGPRSERERVKPGGVCIQPMALDPLLLEEALRPRFTAFSTSQIPPQLGSRRRIPKWGRRPCIQRLVVPSLFSSIRGVSLLSRCQGLVTLDCRELIYHPWPEYCFHCPGSHLLGTF